MLMLLRSRKRKKQKTWKLSPRTLMKRSQARKMSLMRKPSYFLKLRILRSLLFSAPMFGPVFKICSQTTLNLNLLYQDRVLSLNQNTMLDSKGVYYMLTILLRNHFKSDKKVRATIITTFKDWSSFLIQTMLHIHAWIQRAKLLLLMTSMSISKEYV